MALHLLIHQLDQLLSRVADMFASQLHHMFSSELLAGIVLGLAESVGLEKQHVVRLQLRLLGLESPVGQSSYGQVWLDG